MKKVYLFLFIFLFSFDVFADLKIDITGGHSEPMPIAITDFSGVRRANDVRQILVDDLESSGLFRVINKDAYIQKIKDVNETPNFVDWQTINAQALLVANVERADDGKLKIAFRLWDVYGGQVMIGRALTLSENEWRRLGHIVADMAYSRITGESGYFDTRIVYISETGHAGKRKKRLAMMDQDGANQHYLTDGKTLVLTPRFAPNMQKIAYMSYQGGKPRVFVMDLQTMEQKDLGRFEGMSFAPRFSPDSQTLAMSLSKNGNSEIYLYDLTTGKKRQITNHPAIDTSPCFSPDGQKIVFNSDRSGSQQLYVMDKDGKNVKRISFGAKGSYATPVWSPRGDYIAFTKIQDGTFYIGIMRPDGSAERLIAKGFLVEGPAFAPNGRVLAFFKQTPNDVDDYAKTGIYTIDVTGHNEQYLNTPTDASDPAWSPLLFEKK
ncbi:MAG: Tol-Pal system protein TolB [Alphaproteobacteria bacterium]|nr:Tol-Pal system protein TolB [Alphaproteobacteria bacterium]